MSHANGQVKFSDGTIMHYEYDGTVDVVCNCLYKDYEEMNINWRKQPNMQCTCGNSEPVQIATDYGFGFWWPGSACRYCRAIVTGLGTGMDESLYGKENDGLPSWWV